jgi:hypothetical protein
MHHPAAGKPDNTATTKRSVYTHESLQESARNANPIRINQHHAPTPKDSESLMSKGASKTINVQGKMQQTKGPISLTGAFMARSSICS